MNRHKWIYVVLVAFIFSIGGCTKPGPAKRETPLTPPDDVKMKPTKKGFKLPDNPDE
jgi:hypothetical protein